MTVIPSCTSTTPSIQELDEFISHHTKKECFVALKSGLICRGEFSGDNYKASIEDSYCLFNMKFLGYMGESKDLKLCTLLSAREEYMVGERYIDNTDLPDFLSTSVNALVTRELSNMPTDYVEYIVLVDSLRKKVF